MSIKSKAIKCAIGVIIALTVTIGSTLKSVSGNPLRFSVAAMEVMGNAEGCRRDPYLCPAGLLTQGLGHTGQGVGDVAAATDAQIAMWFARDQLDAQNCIETHVEKKTGLRLPQGVFDGIGSFIFNVGCGKFRGYPIYRLLITGDLVGACNRLSLYVYAGKQLLPGLVDRRSKERQLCLLGLTS